MMDREFPQAAAEWDDNVSRRSFMKLMGASLALAGLTTAGCTKKPAGIVPYVQQPENLIPGRSLFYASAMPWMGYGKGVLVEQHEGRPTKVEGNRDHPSSLGAADVWCQASILTQYDPDRSQALTRFGNVSSWSSFQLALSDALTFADWNGAKQTRRTAPARVRILTETVTSRRSRPRLRRSSRRSPSSSGTSTTRSAGTTPGRRPSRRSATTSSRSTTSARPRSSSRSTRTSSSTTPGRCGTRTTT
jgi:molybdopterin-containing oxidoreductase family iron-sulfur binding subunit